MTKTVRVAILDDHQGIIDGYLYRLQGVPEIEVVGTAYFGEDLLPMLAHHPADVLLLDVNVPSSHTNRNPYPILHTIPELQQDHPGLAVLVISMLSESSLIRAVMDAGASGYLLKDDYEAIRQLGAIVLSVAGGGIYLSQQAHQHLFRRQSQDDPRLTQRQMEALSLCAAYPNWSTAELAGCLGVSNSTVRNLLSSTYIKLDVRNRAAAIAKAQLLGLIAPLKPTSPF